jgi:hypothetical protein
MESALKPLDENPVSQELRITIPNPLSTHRCLANLIGVFSRPLTMVIYRRCVSILILGTFFFSEGFAQTGDWQRVRNLPLGEPLVLTTRAGERYHGGFVRATEDSVSIDSDERAFPGRRKRLRDVPRSDVREIRRYRPDASTLAVTGIGAGVGAGLGAGIDAGARSNEDRGLATALFTVLGGALGWAIGRHSTLIKGERIYVAP